MMYTLLLVLIGIALVLLVWLVVRPAMLATTAGRLLGVAAVILLPALVTLGGTAHHFEESKRTAFCLSCHEMHPYGKSLWIDDPDLLPAAHYQNSRVPRDQACYTCHTHYTLYGDATSKWRGVRHVWVHYTRPKLKPEDIHLYRPYRNRECLHCHAGARSFVENEGHEGLLPELTRNETSCLDCHGPAHDVKDLATRRFWAPPGGDSGAGS